jgi:phage terminase large subunit GpA-like protein
VRKKKKKPVKRRGAWKLIHEYPLLPIEAEAFLIKDRPPISKWAMENIVLNGSYVYPGAFRPSAWQVEPLDAITTWNRVRFMGPPQTGKSLLTDIVMYYSMAVLNLSGLVVYDRAETVKDVFKMRIRGMITDNPSLRALWDGQEDNLTSDNMVFRSCFWRVGSAQNQRSLSTFPAGIAICSEVGKWRKVDFDPVEMIRGRGGAFWKKGQQKEILESTPFDVGDYLYREVFNGNCLILSPHFKCPHCHRYHVYTDSQIKMRMPDGVEPDKNPERIRRGKEGAVAYICPACKAEITETERYEAETDVVWAAEEIKEGAFEQEAETVLPDGTVDTDARKSFSAVCYRWNRLVDTAYPFWECLAKFFESKNDAERMRMYQTEVMARYYKRSTERISVAYLESKRQGYNQYDMTGKIPDDVLIITAGVDTQDDCFYYVLVGWCQYMKFYILRHDTIHCPINDPQFRDQAAVFAQFTNGLNRFPLQYPSGSQANIRLGFVDRGGHRPEHVDYICSHNSTFQPYIGLTRPNLQKDLVYKSDSGGHWLGQSERLSEMTSKLIEAEDWFIPEDCGEEFLRGLVLQYHKTATDRDGKVSTKWIHGGNDHYRDCFNLAYGAARVLKLDRAMFDERVVATLRGKTSSITEPQEARPVKGKERAEQYSRRQQGRNGFSRVYGR